MTPWSLLMAFVTELVSREEPEQLDGVGRNGVTPGTIRGRSACSGRRCTDVPRYVDGRLDVLSDPGDQLMTPFFQYAPRQNPLVLVEAHDHGPS